MFTMVEESYPITKLLRMTIRTYKFNDWPIRKVGVISPV